MLEKVVHLSIGQLSNPRSRRCIQMLAHSIYYQGQHPRKILDHNNQCIFCRGILTFPIRIRKFPCNNSNHVPAYQHKELRLVLYLHILPGPSSRHTRIYHIARSNHFQKVCYNWLPRNCYRCYRCYRLDPRI